MKYVSWIELGECKAEGCVPKDIMKSTTNFEFLCQPVSESVDG